MNKGTKVFVSKEDDGVTWDVEAEFVSMFRGSHVVKVGDFLHSKQHVKRADIGSKGKTYNTAVRISGGLLATYTFESEELAITWVEKEVPGLRSEYGSINFDIYDIEPLEVGGTCYVSGEGSEVFTILEVHETSPHRPVFVLDSGFVESVYKCYPNTH